MPKGANFGAFRFGSGMTFGYIEPTEDDDMKAEVVTVGTTPTLIASEATTSVPNATIVQNPVGGVNVYIGGEEVTADDEPTGGLILGGGAALGWDLFREGDFYAVVATGSQKIRVLRRNAE